MSLATKEKATAGSGQQRLDPGRANKIVERKTAHVVGRPQHLAVPVTGLQVGVVLENAAMHTQLLREERLRQELALAREICDGVGKVFDVALQPEPVLVGCSL